MRQETDRPVVLGLVAGLGGFEEREDYGVLPVLWEVPKPEAGVVQVG